MSSEEAFSSSCIVFLLSGVHEDTNCSSSIFMACQASNGTALPHAHSAESLIRVMLVLPARRREKRNGVVVGSQHH